MNDYTVAVRVHCSEDIADLVAEFADNVLHGLDADVVLLDENGNEIHPAHGVSDND